MFNVEADHQHAGYTALYFLLQTLIIVWIISITQHAGRFLFFLLIFDDMDATESYHATEKSGILLRMNFILIDNTE